MNRFIRTKMIYLLLGIMLVMVLYLLYKKSVAQVKVSEFGRYQGHITPALSPAFLPFLKINVG